VRIWCETMLLEVVFVEYVREGRIKLKGYGEEYRRHIWYAWKSYSLELDLAFLHVVSRQFIFNVICHRTVYFLRESENSRLVSLIPMFCLLGLYVAGRRVRFI
jgi:hypothetical protein